jgi:hypothetical protein
VARKKDKKIEDAPDIIEEKVEIESPEENDLIISEEAVIGGLSAIVKIQEEVKVNQNHDANIRSLDFNGKLNIENPSKVDRIWDIALELKNIEGTSLEAGEIQIRELGTEADNSIDSRDFEITGEAKNLLIVKEYINTMSNADDILNFNDIETDLINLPDKIRFVGEEEEFEPIAVVSHEPEMKEDLEPEIEEDLEAEVKPEPKEKSTIEDNVLGWLQQLQNYRKEKPEMEDGGVDAAEYSLESHGISLNQVNKVHFAIGIRNLFKSDVINIWVIKNFPQGFENITIVDKNMGEASLENNQLIWNIESLKTENTALIKFTADIEIISSDPVKTGNIEVKFVGTSSITGGIELENFKASTKNSYFMDILERDDEPDLWDCSLVIDNTSDFKIEIIDVDIYAPEDVSKKFIELNQENLPKLPPGQKWNSDSWEYKSSGFPSFKRNLEFRVLPEVQAEASGTITIGDVYLILASITGEVAYESAEMLLGVEQEENIIKINSYTDSDIETTLSLVNNGSAPLNELSLEMGNFSDTFKPPNIDEVKLLWDGTDIEIPPGAISIEAHSPEALTIVLKNLKDSSTGMLNPNSKLDAVFPVHAINPTQDTEFKPVIIFKANTFPLGQPIEYIPPTEEVPELRVVHIRRKYRKGKEIIPIGAIGNYQIVIHFENVGNVTLEKIELVDRVLDNFNYGEFSLEPDKIADEKGMDILSWKLDSIEPGQKIEITYDIQGEGEYSPKDAQLAL